MVGRFILAVIVVASSMCAFASQQDPLPSDVRRAVGAAPVNPVPPNTESVALPSEPDRLAGPESVEARRARARQRYENVAQHLPEAHAAWDQRIMESLKRAEQLLEELRRTQEELRSQSPVRRAEYTTPIQPSVDRGVPGNREQQGPAQTSPQSVSGRDAKVAPSPVALPSVSRPPALDEPIGGKTAAPSSDPTDLAARCEQLATQLLNLAAQLRTDSTGPTRALERSAPPSDRESK
jgi:hypothetical protein